MIFTFLLATRLPNPTGENLYIPTIPPKKLKETLLSHNKSVIVFQDNSYLLSFMDYGIFRFKDDIFFAQTEYSQSKSYKGCDDEPCILPFSYDKQIITEPHPYSQFGFALWLQNLFTPGVIYIRSYDQFQKFLDNEYVRLIGVDVDERPSSIKNNILFYSINSSLLEQMNLNKIEKGIYVYRNNERRFVPYGKEKVENQIKSSFIDLENIENEKVKNFLCGYIIPSDYDLTKELEAIDKVIPNHHKKFSFSIGSEKKGQSIISMGKLKKANPPYFFALDTKNYSKGKWIVSNESRYDSEYLDRLLSNIEKNKEPFSKISAQVHNPENCTFKEINRDMYHDIISDKENDVLLVITAPWCHHCKHFKPVLNVTSKLFKENNIPVKIYWIDGTTNELPDDFPDYTGFPTLFMFTTTNKTAISYDGDRTVPALIDFIHVNGSVKFTDPVYDMQKIDDEIEKLRDQIENS